ncbi:MAG: retroviral-like aspartic protease family protein [Erythrobacter sp.]|uniref:retroviral-like aspartic protease family protein n=1 Tax=Erythrobacter sp. TaxID=1042 RepID=UPI0025F88F1E|nr:retroviral-like aspartic protease family protein [Erythrobacter sp.]MCM0000204.1 retroviral-like aspartic protease family protein [Erythrobacter sp.]
MTARFILATALLGASLPAGAEPEASPPAPAATSTATAGIVDPAAETLLLEEERYRRLTLPVRVEGTGPFAFMIDTGSQATAVTHKIRELAGLAPAGTATLVGMASRREVELANVGRIEFGTNSYTNFTAPVLERANVGADGIIGLDALQDFRVLIDFRAQTISVEDASVKESRGGFEIVVRAKSRLGQLLITDAIVEGVRATVIIDTGAQASLGNLALREKIRARRAQEVITTDVNGVGILGELAVVRTLSIAGLSLVHVPLTFADAPAFAALGLDDEPVLSIGMQHLALFDRVAIDFARKRIAFDVPADIARAIRLGQRGGSYRARY